MEAGAGVGQASFVEVEITDRPASGAPRDFAGREEARDRRRLRPKRTTLAAAERLGEFFGGHGLTVVCGGGLVAIGGGHGTTAEVAFSRRFGVPVFGILDAPALDRPRPCADPETALEQVARVVLRSPLEDWRRISVAYATWSRR